MEPLNRKEPTGRLTFGVAFDAALPLGREPAEVGALQCRDEIGRTARSAGGGQAAQQPLGGEQGHLGVVGYLEEPVLARGHPGYPVLVGE